jgi:hypothetical protein
MILTSIIPKSQIFEDIEKIFSFEENGLMITDLDCAWRNARYSSILIVESYFHFIGLFLDRELSLIENTIDQSDCCVFVSGEPIEKYKHLDGKELKYKLVHNEGIFIGNDE